LYTNNPLNRSYFIGSLLYANYLPTEYKQQVQPLDSK
jgi:hypothetical protein